MKDKILAVLLLLACTTCSRAHDVVVHQHITMSAESVVAAQSVGYQSFLDTVGITNSATQLLVSFNTDYEAYPIVGENGWITIGAMREDDLGEDIGGVRPFNHFYNPLNGQGLSDIPPFEGDGNVIYGRDSYDWGAWLNEPGISAELPFPNIDPTNTWTWQNIRWYELQALTNSDPIIQNAFLSEMFRGLGDVVHLLQDTSQPQHVRNEQHLSFWPPYASAIEKYGSDHWKQLNYSANMLDWRGLGFTKMKDFWDRGLYKAKLAQALDADAGGGNQLGLAEFSNGNFIGKTTMYPEFFSTSDKDYSKHYFPYPSLFTSTTFPKLRSSLGYGVRNVFLKNGQLGNRVYLDKVNDGITYSNCSVLTYLAVKYRSTGIQLLEAGSTIDDDNVLKAYHDILIPKAVAYTAGLIDYFFRGTISATVTDFDTNTMKYTVSVQNSSSQDFGGGAFYFFIQDTNGVRTLATNVPLNSILSSPYVLASGNSMTMKVPGPITNSQLLCVYQGNIGVDASGNPLDPVDTNIAIAATLLNDRTITFDMTYDNTNAEADFYLTDPCGVTHYEPDLYPNITSTCCNVEGGDNEDDSQAHQHMIVSDVEDGNYVLWVNYEGDDTNAVNCTLVTSSAFGGVLSTNTFTLNTPASGQYNQYGWPIGVVGPATVDTNGVPTTNNASWYVRKAVTISNGHPTGW